MSIKVYWFAHLLAVFSLGCLGFCVEYRTHSTSGRLWQCCMGHTVVSILH